MSRSIPARAATAVAILLLSASHGQSQDTNQFDGKSIFRFDTFGDEQLWTNTLQLQKPIANVSPRTALAVGLKVDSDALPPAVINAIKTGQVNLDDPAVTKVLLQLNAVIGVIGKVAPDNTLTSVGITCALCHSTVDNSVAPGIGRRQDGWPNRDLNVGAIISLSPVLANNTAPFLSWGPGKFDARLQFFDGTAIRSLNSPTSPVVIAPAFGLKGVGFETYTGDGVVAYWNNYVGVTQMGGHGSFSDPRIGITVTQTPDLVTPKLPALVKYELSLETPPPPKGSFNGAAADRGEKLFNGAAGCARCHQPPLFTDVLSGSGPGHNAPFLHSPAEVGQDPVSAARSATKAYRTTPLRALWQHPPYFHDGSAPDLLAVVNHYNSLFHLGLADQQKADLVEYLKTL
jgi:mono/diheme cytochrome c family protein